MVEVLAGDDVRCSVRHAVDHNLLDAGVRRIVRFAIKSVGYIGIMHARGQGRSIRTHEARDVRSGDLTFGEQFEGA